MKILVDSIPEKIDDCPYASIVPFSKPRTFICEMDPYMEECKGVDCCPVFMSYDEFKNRTYKQSSHKPIAKCNHFVEGVENYHMTNPLEILNWYRNLYYQEDCHSEQRIMAEAINNLFMKYKDVFGRESEAG